MASGGADDPFLIGPILEWWEKLSANRDAKRIARAEANTAVRNRD